MIESYLDLASAVIIPALSLIVAAIGLRNDIRKRREELLTNENDRREQFNSELLTERNTRHDEIIKYTTRELERARDDLDKIREDLNQCRMDNEVLKTQISHLMDRFDDLSSKLERALSKNRLDKGPGDE